MINTRLLLLPIITFGPFIAATAASTPSEPGSAAVDEIDEIIVTATRRTTPLQETALSVGVLAQDSMDRAGLRSFDDYWRQIPSMSVTDSGPFGTLTVIRGLSANFGAVTDEPLTSLYLDETPLTNIAGYFTAPPDIYLVDMERVEVLRGPQGTLFGASSMGGTIRNITRKPDTSRSGYSVETRVSGTRHGGLNNEINGVFNQVLVPERSALRFVAYYRDDEGFVDDIGLGREDVNWSRTRGIRLSASTLVGDRLSLTGKIVYQDSDVGSFNEVDPNGKPEIGLPTTGDYQLALFVPESRSDELLLYNLEARYTTPAADWLSITSYFENKAEYVLDIADEMNVFYGQYLPTAIDGSFSQDVFTQEFRVISNSDGPVDWLAGLFYMHQDVPWQEATPAPGFNNTPFCADENPPPPPDAPFPTCSGLPDGEEYLNDAEGKVDRDDFAAYGSVGYELSDRWQAAIGVRWYESTSSLTELGGGGGLWAGGFDLPPVAEDLADEDGTTWSGSLAFRPASGTMVFARAAQGFRPGGSNGPGLMDICSAASERYESDTLWSYDLGARTSFFDNQLTVNATMYYIDWSDAQVTVFDWDCGSYYTANSGKAKSQGLELELSAEISDRWSLAVSAGYTDAILEEDLDDPAIDAPAGTELPYVPDVTASLTSDHRFSVFGDLDGFARIEAQHTGRSYSQLDRAARIELPSYTLVNLRAGVDTGEWRTELFAENVFDDKAIYSCCRLNGEHVVNRPRTVGLRVSYGR